MTVLVGFIPSPEGWAALEAAIDRVRRDGGRLVVVNSSRGDAYVDPRYAQDHHLRDLHGRIEAAGIPYEVEQRMRGEDAADELLRAAHAHDADLIVIGIRHRSPVGKLLLGSTAQRVLLTAPCPVLAVKPSGSGAGGGAVTYRDGSERGPSA